MTKHTDHKITQLFVQLEKLLNPLGAMLIDLIRETISHYVIHFRMAKVHELPLAAVYTAVSGEA